MRTIEALALAIAGEDHSPEHLERLKVYSLAIGKELALSEDEMRALETAALLHDVGQLAVPEHLKSKSGKLTLEEFEKMKIHPVIGAQILDRVQFPYPVSPIVLSHHERWDGTGYPRGLRGEEIPIGARILAVVDTMDALASPRNHRRALSLAETVRFLDAESGRSFDPRVVAVLKRLVGDLDHLPPHGAYVSSNLPSSTNQGDDTATDPFLRSIAAARHETRGVLELAQGLGRSLSLSETHRLISAHVMRMIPCDALSISYIEGHSVGIEFASGHHAEKLNSLDVRMGEGLLGWVAENRRPIINGNMDCEVGYVATSVAPVPLRSMLALPLEDITLEGSDSIVGLLAVYSVQPEAFTREHLRLLLPVVAIISDSLGNAHRYERAKREATTDTSTRLPNARALFEYLDEVLARQPQSVTIVVCSLDGFEEVNERFGYLKAEQLLGRLADELRGIRQADFVARIGDQDFVLLMPSGMKYDLAAISEQIVAAVQVASGTTFGQSLLLPRLGHAVAPGDGTNSEKLLAEANRRRRRSKSPLFVSSFGGGELLSRKMKVFLCHASGDKPAVRRLYQQLCDSGIDAWLDEQKLIPGQDWNLEITRAVRTSDAVLVCLSQRSTTKTGYVQREIKYALDAAQSQPEGSIFLIPARLEDCNVPDSLQRWQYVNLYEDDSLDKLLSALSTRAKDLSS